MIQELLHLDAPYELMQLGWKIVAGLCACFLGIVFCQSAFDKISDYKGNLEYFKSQFSKSVLAKSVRLLLAVLTLMEAVSGFLCLVGIILGIFHVTIDVIGFGLFLSACTLLCLLFGQRIAKDYAGAASLTGYFLVAVFGLTAFGIGY